MQQPEPASRRQIVVLAVVGALLVGFLVARGSIDRTTLVVLGVLFGSVILHEVSHGVVALAFGDDTAKQAGRLTLNPVRHVDMFGTIVLPVILVLTNAPVFGWAKPVPVNPSRLRRPRDHTVLVSLAGPAVNIVLALVAAVALRAVLTGSDGFEDRVPLGTELLIRLGLTNVVLAVFNLLPIPPLDGSAVVERLLPGRWWPGYLRLRQYSMGVLLVLVLMLPNALERVFRPAIAGWVNLVT